MKNLVSIGLAVAAAAAFANEKMIQAQPASDPVLHGNQVVVRAIARAQPEMARVQHEAGLVLDGQASLLAQSVGGVRRDRAVAMPAHRQIRTLVASPRVTDPKEIDQIEEDLAVMSRLLNKDVDREVNGGNDRAMGIFITSVGGNSRPPEAVYLEGFGALFTLNVNFPLLPNPEEKPGKAEAAPMDSDWDKARAELFGGAAPNQPGFGHVTVMGLDQPPQPYDAEKVESLKQTILATLRNAANLRVLKPDDYIHVAVQSLPGRNEFFGAGGAHGMATSHVTVTMSQDGKTTTKTVKSGPEGGRNSTLNIRVKRAEVEALVKGKLTLDEFKQKAAVTIN